MNLLKTIRNILTKPKPRLPYLINPIISPLNKLSNTLIITNKFNYENNLTIHSQVLKCEISNTVIITNRFDKLEHLTNKNDTCIINLHDAIDFQTIEKFTPVYKCIILSYDKDMRGISPSKMLGIIQHISKINKLNHKPTTLLIDNYCHSFNLGNENLSMFMQLIKDSNLTTNNLVNIIANVNIESKSWWFANRTLLDILIKREYYFSSNKQFKDGFSLFDLTILHNITECLSVINGLNVAITSQDSDEDYNEFNIYSKIANNFCSFNGDIYTTKEIDKIIQNITISSMIYIYNKR